MDGKDIVQRIRERFPRPKYADDGLLANEAADEIEQLRAAYDDAVDYYSNRCGQ